MATKLDKSIKRELEHAGKTYTWKRESATVHTCPGLRSSAAMPR
jgi:hypothetical protein